MKIKAKWTRTPADSTKLAISDEGASVPHGPHDEVASRAERDTIACEH